jgi:hypothetical protein
MTRDNNILSWLKTFFVHSDFDSIPDDFDIFDEIEIRDRTPQNSINKEGNDAGRIGNGGTKKTPPIDTNVPPIKPKFDDPLLNEAYRFGKDDYELLLLENALSDIYTFERELDNSLEQLDNKFSKKIYQYDTE